MTAGAAVMAALRQFGIPCVPDLYDGENESYFTYNYADEAPADYGDNAPSCAVASVQVHLFLPLWENPGRMKREVRAALAHAGFTCPSVTAFADPGGKKKHLIFECEFEEALEE